jgi:hypothetical protein
MLHFATFAILLATVVAAPIKQRQDNPLPIGITLDTGDANNSARLLNLGDDATHKGLLPALTDLLTGGGSRNATRRN